MCAGRFLKHCLALPFGGFLDVGLILIVRTVLHDLL
jgi:hypothetical protein